MNGNNDIFVMNQNGTNQTALTSDPADDWLPDISPDGTKIAFHSNRAGNNDIRIMNVDGTGLNRLTTAHLMKCIQVSVLVGRDLFSNQTKPEMLISGW